MSAAVSASAASLADVASATASTGGALSTGVETLQFVLPEVRLDKGTPNSNGPDLITVDYDLRVMDNLSAAQPLWVVWRTADNAL